MFCLSSLLFLVKSYIYREVICTNNIPLVWNIIKHPTNIHRILSIRSIKFLSSSFHFSDRYNVFFLYYVASPHHTTPAHGVHLHLYEHLFFIFLLWKLLWTRGNNITLNHFIYFIFSRKTFFPIFIWISTTTVLVGVCYVYYNVQHFNNIL